MIYIYKTVFKNFTKFEDMSFLWENIVANAKTCELTADKEKWEKGRNHNEIPWFIAYLHDILVGKALYFFISQAI